MNYYDCLTTAIDVVLAWDIPDEAIGEAVTAQAQLLAHSCID